MQSQSTMRNTLALLALGLGSFVISTSEFASMGLLPLFADDLFLTVPQATNAISLYALGVVVGAPVLTIAAAKVNKRPLLIALMVLALLANLFTAWADNLGMLMLGRFLSGLPQGVYFGAATVVAAQIAGPGRSGWAVSLVMSGITLATVVGAPVGTWVGQIFGWRSAYAAIGLVSAVPFFALMFLVPKSSAFDGGSISREMSALRRGYIWAVMLFSAIAIASVFSVYTFVGPFVTEVAGLDAGMTPIALTLIGLGMAVGTIVGGRLADASPHKAIIVGLVGTMVSLLVMGIFTSSPAVLLISMTVLGFTIMIAGPAIPLLMMRRAPEAPTLMGALNMASFNVANAIGAAAGGFAIEAGLGLTSPIWGGFVLTSAGLVIFLLIVGVSSRRPAAVLA